MKKHDLLIVSIVAIIVINKSFGFEQYNVKWCFALIMWMLWYLIDKVLFIKARIESYLEKKFYIVDPTCGIKNPDEMSDELFMKYAKVVYSVKEFELAFNNSNSMLELYVSTCYCRLL